VALLTIYIDPLRIYVPVSCPQLVEMTTYTSAVDHTSMSFHP